MVSPRPFSIEPSMDGHIDLYDLNGHYFLSRDDQIVASTTSSHGIADSVEPGELANLVNAADASKVMRARLPQQSIQDSHEAYPNEHEMNEAELNNHLFDEVCALLGIDKSGEVDLIDHHFNGFSSNLHFDEDYPNNPQFDQADRYEHQLNEACPHNHHSVDATSNLKEIDTTEDQLRNFKRRRTEYTESSHVGLDHELVPSATSGARTSIASVSTDRSSRLSASTARSSFVSMSTSRSSVASMVSPFPQSDQLGEEGGYKWKCLICHMGEGDSRKAYVRKEANTPSDQASAETLDVTTRVSAGRAPKPKNSWNSQTLLEKHMRENHLFMFRRTISSEYICIFCRCGHVTDEHCEGRFLDKDSLLKHVSQAHHEIPSLRIRYDHYCAPLNSRSYPQKLFDRLTRRDGSASD